MEGQDVESTPAATDTEHWARWVLAGRGDYVAPRDRDPFHAQLRDVVLGYAAPQPGESLLDVGCGDGLVGFGALPLVGETGRVIFSDIAPQLVDHCSRAARQEGVLDRCGFLVASADDLREVDSGSVDIVTTRSVLLFVHDKPRALSEFRRVLRPGGRLVMFEPINSFGQPEPPNRFWGFDLSAIPEIAQKLHAAHEAHRLGPCASMTGYDERDVLDMLDAAGFRERLMQLTAEILDTPLLDSRVWRDFLSTAPNPLVPTFERFIAETLTEDEALVLEQQLRPLVEAGDGVRRAATAYFWARP